MSDKLRVYLAGPSSEIGRVIRCADALHASGRVEITYRWWLAVMQHGVGRDGELTLDQQAKHAHADLLGIERATVVWALWPAARSLGVPLELGYALGKSRTIIVSGANVGGCIFTALANLRTESDDEALAEVLDLAYPDTRRLLAGASPDGVVP